MRPTSEAIFENMKPIIIERLSLANPEVVTIDADFLEHLGADSLDMADMALALEAKFLVEITDEEMQKLRTVEDAVKLIEEKQTPSGTLYQRIRTH